MRKKILNFIMLISVGVTLSACSETKMLGGESPVSYTTGVVKWLVLNDNGTNKKGTHTASKGGAAFVGGKPPVYTPKKTVKRSFNNI